MAFTGRNLVERSLRLLGVLAVGENASSNELSDGINTINQMLGSWSAENLLINAHVREEFTLIVDQSSYTIGATGADFTTTRPVKIESLGIEYGTGSNITETPVKILSQSQYAGLRAKEVSSNIPFAAYVEGTYPNETINLYPVPSDANRLVVYSLKALTEIAANTTVDLLQGYLKALVYNGAVDLAAEYGQMPSEIVLREAIESKAIIKRQNQRLTLMTTDAPIRRGGYNIETNE